MIHKLNAEEHENWGQIPEYEDRVHSIGAIGVAINLVHDVLFEVFGIKFLVLAHTLVDLTLFLFNSVDYCPDVTSDLREVVSIKKV